MSRVFESCIKSLPQGCANCVLADECAEKQLYEKGRADAIGEELQRFAQWLWDNHYLVDEAFTIRLVEQYKSEQMKEQNNTYTATVDGVKREFM